MSTEVVSKRQTCTDHAACCGQHFHGLGAFDAHRKDGICYEASEVVYGSNSKKRSGEPMLQAWTEAGSCDKERGCWVNGKRDHYVEGVTVWQMATTEEQRERLSDAWVKPSAPQMGFAL